MKYSICYTLFFLGCLLLVPTSGCITLSEMRFQNGFKKYQPEQYPVIISGTYFGRLKSSNEYYDLFYFPHFPWGTHDNSYDSMAVIMGAELTEEPVLTQVSYHVA